MDKMFYREIDSKERLSDEDVATLLEQLDDSAPAPMDAGMQLLCRKIDELRRRSGHHSS